MNTKIQYIMLEVQKDQSICICLHIWQVSRKKCPQGTIFLSFSTLTFWLIQVSQVSFQIPLENASKKICSTYIHSIVRSLWPELGQLWPEWSLNLNSDNLPPKRGHLSPKIHHHQKLMKIYPKNFLADFLYSKRYILVLNFGKNV